MIIFLLVWRCEARAAACPVCFASVLQAASTAGSPARSPTALLRAGASLDYENRGGWIQSFEEHLNHIDVDPDRRAHVGAIRNLVASVRAAGSWKAHCRLPHKQILRLRSLVARGQMRERLATTRAIRFIVRQGDNGIVWNILSFWRATD